MVVEQSALENMQAVAGGYTHSLGLKADGTIVAWGYNDYGQCNVPTPNADFVAIEAGGYHSLGLKTDGTIVAWGRNTSGQCNVPAPNAEFVAVAAGGYHSLGLKADGTIVAWGSNGNGQCSVPAPNAGFVAVAAGGYHSLGLKADGTIVAWGGNTAGQCNVPAPNADFVAVAAGSYHSLALKADGTIVAWGYNDYGQCNVPTPNADFVAVAAGCYHSLGLKADGTFVTWGRNDEGQCSMPAPNVDFVAVAAGCYHSLALKADGTIVAWGWNNNGQCNVPAPNADIVAVAAGGYHSLGLRSDGTIAAWGNNSFGQCDVPAPNAGFVAVAAGGYHSLGLKADETIAAWGQNSAGQCNVPAPNADFVAVAGGDQHNLGLKADGTIVAWGYNNYGQCNVPAPNADFVAVAAGYEHSLGLKADGTIVAWGYNGYGQCDVPAPNTDFVAVAGGDQHDLGLKADGTIVAWGRNTSGQCNVPAPNADFVAVAGGYWHSLGLKVDGTIVAWGSNGNGQCNVPAPNTDFVAVAGGMGYSLGLKVGADTPWPVLLAPANGAAVASVVEFSWYGQPAAQGYQIVLSPDASLTEPVWARTVSIAETAATYSVGPEFPPGETFYWSVRASVDGGWGPYAPVRSIRREATALPLDAPVLHAPTNGAEVGLPESYSWSPVDAAQSYEIEVASEPGFTAVLWQTETAESFARVPAAAGPDLGQPYFWHVRALAPGRESIWSTTSSFIRVLEASPPGEPSLVAPLDAAIEPGPAVAFTWTPAEGATEYALVVSKSPYLLPTPGTSWFIDGIHSTSYIASLSPALGTLYWSVAGRNSAGQGAAAPTRSFAYGYEAPPLASCTIVSPPPGLEVPQGATVLGSAFVAGSQVGTVTVQWLLDAVQFTSFEVEMDGVGFETPSVLVPTADLGDHSLSLRVTGAGEVTSPPIAVHIMSRTFGPPDHLALTPQHADLSPGQVTAVYCRVLDAEGRLVEDDTGRSVSLSLAGDGSLDPLEIITSGGSGSALYTAPLEPGIATVVAASGGLAGASVQLTTHTGELEQLRAEANAYLARLGNLTWDLYDETKALSRSLNVSQAQELVAGAEAGDEQVLRRLTMFLRVLDRAWYYDPAKHSNGPLEQPAPIPGAQVLCDDVARSLGHVGLVLMKSLAHLDKLAGNPILDAAIRLVKNMIVWGADQAVRTALLLVHDDGIRRYIGDGWSDLKEVISAVNTDHGITSALGALADAGVRAHLGDPIAVRGFVDRTQPYLDEVVEALSAPGWAGGDDTWLNGAIESRIDEICTASEGQDVKLELTLRAFGIVEWVTILEDAASRLGGVASIFKFGALLNRGIEAALVWSAGVDCHTTVLEITGAGGLGVIADEVVADYALAAGALQVMPLAITAHREEAALSQVGLLASTGHAERSIAEAEESLRRYEDAVRALEVGLSAADTMLVRVALTDLDDGGRRLLNGWGHLSATILSTAAGAAISFPNFPEIGDSVLASQLSALSSSRALAALAADWLAYPDDELLRLSARDQAQLSIDAARESQSRAAALILSLLATPSEAFLLADIPTAPDGLAHFGTGTVHATISNLGAATAYQVSASIQADSSQIEVLAPAAIQIDSLAAGERLECAWTVRMLAYREQTDSTQVIIGSVAPSAANGQTPGSTLVISLLPGVAVAVPGEGAELPASPTLADNFPNPFNPQTTIRFSVPREGRAVLRVYDVQGRAVDTLVDEVLSPGWHDARWDGRRQGGQPMASGLYLLRLEASGATVSGKVTLLR